MAGMDAAALRAVCKERKLYLTPRLNERLYASFRGFTSIGGLDEYTELKALHLDGNALESLAGLPPLPQLKCLFLQSNRLAQLGAEQLGGLPQLDTLNVAGNCLTGLEGLEACAPSLRTLVASDNRLGSPAGLVPLAACTQLESLDLQNNKLEDAGALLDVLRHLPRLKCLYLRGNPFASGMHNYRKTLLATCTGLTYLDDRPVFDTERRCAGAWARGGLEAERAERAACAAEKAATERANFEALQRVREEGFRRRREVLGLPPGTTDPFFDTLDLSAAEEGGNMQEEEEPAELVAAHQRLAALHRDKGGEGDGTGADEGAAEEELPPLSTADVDAVLEESRAQRRELLAEMATSPRVENEQPNATVAAAAAPAPPAPPTTGAIPPARRTVLLGAGGAAPACQPACTNDSTPTSQLTCGRASQPSADVVAAPVAAQDDWSYDDLDALD